MDAEQSVEQNVEVPVLRIYKMRVYGVDELPSVDPKSLSMLSYLLLCKHNHRLDFTLKSEDIDLEHIPNFHINGESVYALDEISATGHNLERLRGIPPCPKVLTIANAVNDIKDVCIYGLNLLMPNNDIWRLRTPNALEKDNEEEDRLKQRMIDSCAFLSDMLDANAYLLDKLYKIGDYPSYLDAELFGHIVLIYKLFGYDSLPDGYCRIVYRMLKQHINLWAYVERLFAQLIGVTMLKSKNYNSEIKDPTFVKKWLARDENVLLGGKRLCNNNVYILRCCDINPLRLPEGKYVLKHSTKYSSDTFETEIMIHEKLRYQSYIQAIGHGDRSKDVKNNILESEGFIILPFKKNGSLQDHIDGLNWPTALKISREIAYAVHLAHTSTLVLCDLKPANILIDDDGSALMCDFGAVKYANCDVGGRTDAYNDGSTAAIPQFDIYCYGMVLFAILTKYVKPGGPNQLDTIIAAISAHEDIFRVKLKNSGCKGIQRRDIFQLALDCIDPLPSARPSALAILRRLDAIAELNQAEPAAADVSIEEVAAKNKGANAMGTLSDHFITKKRPAVNSLSSMIKENHPVFTLKSRQGSF